MMGAVRQGAVEAIPEDVDLARGRQLAWLQKRQIKGQPAWRPKKRFRVSSQHVLLSLNNQMIYAVQHGILDLIPLAEPMPAAITWRRASISLDQGLQ